MLRTCIVLVLFAASPASAKERSRTALKLTAQAIAHFRDGQYTEAIARFEEAYARDKRPDLLFNIAQSYRKVGECAEALDYYRRYLEAEPTAYNRSRVEERIHEMERCSQGVAPPAPITEASKEDSSPLPPLESAWPAPDPEPPLKIIRPPPQRIRGYQRLRVAGVASIGLGLAMTAAAAGLSATAQSASFEVSRVYQEAGQWNEELASVESRGRAATSASAALYTFGAAALVGGGVMVYLGWRPPR
jgi:tetratricopeptide (TPR) repeat protein